MVGFVVSFLVGVICIILGISNMRGNISTLHEYHRHRVSEEDRIPFGKQVGLGTIIMGSGVILFSTLSMISQYISNEILVWIGTALMIVSFIVGGIITFRAMIKYNKGIF
jgi:hypothetical protein